MDEYSSNTKKHHAQIALPAKKSGASPILLATVKAAKAAIEAENEKAKDERNARRWKSQRDPVDYEKQKRGQREEYAAQKGGKVRAYHKIDAKTEAERQKVMQERAAERMRANRKNARQEAKDREADRKFRARKEAAGWTSEEIEAGLERRRANRQTEQANDYQSNPLYGSF